MVKSYIRRLLPGHPKPPALPQKRSTLPPIPRSLRTQLKDYPEHIERLQLALYGITVARTTRRPRVEMAVWAIDDRLSRFSQRRSTNWTLPAAVATRSDWRGRKETRR